ncbi:MAG: DEAD/DEAH box helicase [candidate division Zixibacteria bacterium]|nr:DEAD/DEAH box helicase [candidate division Zixibacteria bacterium]MDH3935722.1 DEAD/DEAH box helicase [candidate division Zixibacteria bacterium]MDH4033718.1 DEAD/DEAH box helicase [candidate division Zixibacteria bacterium]
MRLSDLDKYGIPSKLIDLWRERQGESLLPVQSRAVRKGLLGNSESGSEHDPVRMIVSAPTSSGKSFCAELAAAKALMARQRVLFLFPLKSLVEQKHKVLQDTLGRLGIDCLVVTSDHPENDKKFAEGNYRVALAIYEKFDLLLTAKLDALKNIGLVVIDELQTVGQPGRGALLERLLTKIKASVYTPSQLGLSAVIGDNAASAGRLAEWLEAELVEETSRPVDLIRGVAAEGSFRYRFYNSGLDGSEPFEQTEMGEEPMAGFIRALKQNSGSTLIFLKSRRETVDAAFRLAAAVNWPAASKALQALDEEEPSFLIRSLKQALSRGVAFHNSDLSSRQRAIIEQAFLDKEVRAIFSTTTLAMGVNLPADTVYLETVKYDSGEYGGGASLVPVTRSEFDNMTGRAGRLGLAREGQPGRAVVLAETDFDRDILWENYIAPDQPEAIKSALATTGWADWLLDSIAAGLVQKSNDIGNLFEQTLYATENSLPIDFESVQQNLLDNDLIRCDETDRLSVTASGQAAAVSGMSVKQAIHLRRQLAQDRPTDDVGWIALALSTPDWNLPPGLLSHWEHSQGLPVRMLYQQFGETVGEVSFLLGNCRLSEPLPYRIAASMKALMLTEQWRRMIPVKQLEEQFQMHLGQMMALGDSVAHLVCGLAALIEAEDRDSSLIGQLRELSFSLRFGMPVSMQPLYQQVGHILTRGTLAALYREGITTVKALLELDENELARLIPGTRSLHHLKKYLSSNKKENDMNHNAAIISQPVQKGAMPLVTAPQSVEIDGAYERERYLVKIDGFPVRLTGKSFKYFAKLAWSRLHSESGWIYKEDLEIGFNQARYLYRMKSEISDSLRCDWPVIENNRLGYYRLNVDPSQVQLNIECLKNHPDWEVRSLVDNAGRKAAN